MIVDLSFVQNCRHYWKINTVIRFSERKRDPNRGKNRHAEIVRDVLLFLRDLWPENVMTRRDIKRTRDERYLGYAVIRSATVADFNSNWNFWSPLGRSCSRN